MINISIYLNKWLNGERKSWPEYKHYVERYNNCHKLLKDIPSIDEFIDKVLNLLSEKARNRPNSKEIIEDIFSQKIIIPKAEEEQDKGHYNKDDRLKEDIEYIKLLRHDLEISETEGKKVLDYLKILSDEIIELLKKPFSATGTLPYMVFSGNRYIKILNLLNHIKNNNIVELEKYQNYTVTQLKQNPKLYTDDYSFFHLNTFIFELYGIVNLHKAGVYIYNSSVDLKAFGYQIAKPESFGELFKLFKIYGEFIEQKYGDTIIDSDPTYKDLRDKLPNELSGEQKRTILRHIEIDQFFYSYSKKNKKEGNGAISPDTITALNKDQETKQRTYNKIPRNIILHGPVGTGKTRFARFLAMGITDNKISSIEEIDNLIKGKSGLEKEYENRDIDKQYVQIITFHQSYGYEDFIGGIRAKTDDKGGILYNPEPGIFMKLCNDARKHLDHNYVLIIDEINRGDISRIFGELITLIEEDKREKAINEMKIAIPNFYQTDSDSLFSVPRNVFIIGTMNDSDKSIALLDVALRRRFIFFNVPPNYGVLEGWIKDDYLKGKAIDAFKGLNDVIKNKKDADSQIGHAFFKSLENTDNERKELVNIFKYRIFPLLREIFYRQDNILNDLIPNKFDEKSLTEENIESYLDYLKKLGNEIKNEQQ